MKDRGTLMSQTERDEGGPGMYVGAGWNDYSGFGKATLNYYHGLDQPVAIVFSDWLYRCSFSALMLFIPLT